MVEGLCEMRYSRASPRDSGPDATTSNAQRRAPGWILLAMPLVLALMAGVGILILTNHSEADIKEALLFSRFTENIERLHDLELQAKQPATPKLSPLLYESAIERDLDLAQARISLDDLLVELERYDLEDARRMRPVVAEYFMNVDELASLVASGQINAAASWDEERLDPSFAALRALVANEQARHLSQADRMTYLVDVGTVGVLMLAALTAGLGFRRFESSERRSAVVASERKTLRRSEARFRALVLHSTDVVAIFAPSGTISYLSPGFATLLGYTTAPWIGRDARDLAHPDDLDGVDRTFAALLVSPGEPMTLEVRFIHADGGWRWTEMIATNLIDTPEVGGIVANVRDITEHKGFEEQLTHQAFHDSLTGLPNRALFLDRLTHALSRASRGVSPLAVLFLDLDRFKVVNDSLGHLRGDALLVAVGDRLTACLRAGDTVARIGGDEFAVLLEEADEQTAIDAAARIALGLRSPIRVAGHDLSVGCSIGIALRSSPEDMPHDLLRNADLAMYAAKHEGKGGFAIFDAAMRHHALQEMELEADLRLAMTRDEFRVHYQPIVELATGLLVEVEALVRWQHPTRGLIQPGEFIAMAEETGLIQPIGSWVLLEACRQVREWQETVPSAARLGVAVNLSPWMLWRQALVDDVAAILAETGIAPDRLQLEITEGTMIRDGEATVAALDQLKALGVGLAVDDFGTGYSSLSYLQRFPFDTLKIDRSFVARMGESTESQAIVRAIVDLARGLGLEVTAEGVETATQADLLRDLGSHRAQGYHFGRALPANELARAFFPAALALTGPTAATAA